VGVHYPFDVAGGAVIGALCAIIVIALWEFVHHQMAPRCKALVAKAKRIKKNHG
jgi:membrane-associated phospholipid phosphatase